MTEAEWLACDDPYTMLRFLAAIPSDRKLRYYVAACCRCQSDIVNDPQHRKLIETVEAIADGELPFEALIGARQHLTGPDYALDAVTVNDPYYAAVTGADDLLIHAGQGGYALVSNTASLEEKLAAVEAEYAHASKSHAVLVRELFGNPFQPNPLRDTWLTANVVGLARSIYAEYAFERLPILADALMDAGCEDERVLEHCRREGPHVRGCWVVDMLLGKS